jgi:hypothetical protein
MRRIRTVSLVVAGSVAALAVSPAALAKGPREATVAGPGLEAPVTLTGSADPGVPGLGRLFQESGALRALFGRSSLPANPPSAALGPRFRITYVVIGPGGVDSRIRQHLYPYATPSPLT